MSSLWQIHLTLCVVVVDDAQKDALGRLENALAAALSEDTPLRKAVEELSALPSPFQFADRHQVFEKSGVIYLEPTGPGIAITRRLVRALATVSAGVDGVRLLKESPAMVASEWTPHVTCGRPNLKKGTWGAQASTKSQKISSLANSAGTFTVTGAWRPRCIELCQMGAPPNAPYLCHARLNLGEAPLVWARDGSHQILPQPHDDEYTAMLALAPPTLAVPEPAADGNESSGSAAGEPAEEVEEKPHHHRVRHMHDHEHGHPHRHHSDPHPKDKHKAPAHAAHEETSPESAPGHVVIAFPGGHHAEIALPAEVPDVVRLPEPTTPASFVPRNPLRTSDQVLDRIQHDSKLNPADFTVGWMDRHDGMQQASVGKFLALREAEGVPLHRIHYFARILSPTSSQFVWHRELRIDDILSYD